MRQAGKGRRVEHLDDALRFLLDRSHLLDPRDLPGAVDEGARRLGALGAVVHLVDRDQLLLVPLGRDDRQPLSVEATLAGRAYRTLQVLDSASDGQPRLWVPLLDGAESLGVLELLCRAEQATPLRGDGQVFASLVAELVRSRAPYSDDQARVREQHGKTLAAELLWRQLPPLTFATERFTVTALLEPWSQVGGDAFDYGCDGTLLHLAVLDAMGHGLRATLMASVALAAYRLTRRAGHDLVASAAAMDQAVAEHFGTDAFVTALLVQLDLETGRLSVLSAGHPAPLLLRQGRVVGTVQGEPGLPLGLGDRDDAVADLSLQPGDVLALYTDGVVEARSEDGEFFGVARFADLLTRESAAQQPPPETLRRLVRAVLAHQRGRLQDDATCLLLEWITGRQRSFDLGAEGA